MANDRTVRRRYFPYAFTVSPGTTADFPAELVVPVFETVWERAEVLIPPGHAATTGLAFEYAHERVLPWGDDSAWLVGDGETLDLDAGVQVSGELRLLAFNGGNYDHTFYVRLLLRYLDQAASPADVPLALVV